MDIVWDKEDTQPKVVWDDEDGERSTLSRLGDMPAVAAGTGRFLTEGLGSAVVGGLRAAGTMATGGTVEEGMASLEAGGKSVRDTLDAVVGESGKTSKDTQDMLAWAMDKAVELGGEGTVQALKYHPVFRNLPEEVQRGIGETIINVAADPLAPLGVAARGRMARRAPEPTVNKSDVNAFLAERANKEANDNVRAQIGIEQRGKREGEMADIAQIEQGRAAPDIALEGGPTPVDIRMQGGSPAVPKIDLFEFDDPAMLAEAARKDVFDRLQREHGAALPAQTDMFNPMDAAGTPPLPPGGGGAMPFQKPGLELAPDRAPAAGVDMIDPGMLNPESVAARAERIERLDATRSGERPIAEVLADMRAEREMDRPPQPSWMQAEKTTRPDLSGAAVDPFRTMHAVEKVQTAADFRAMLKEENDRFVREEGGKRPAGATKAGRKERGSVGDPTEYEKQLRAKLKTYEPVPVKVEPLSERPLMTSAQSRASKFMDQDRMIEAAMRSDDPPVGAAFGDATTGNVAGPFLNHHSHGLGWLQGEGRKQGWKYQNIRNGFITKSGKFVTREEAQAQWGSGISEKFPFRQETPQVRAHTGEPISVQSAREEARTVGADEGPSLNTQLNQEQARLNMAKLRGQRGSVMSPAAIMDAIKEGYAGPGRKPTPTKGEFGDFKDMLPEELKSNAKALYDEFKASKRKETLDAVRSDPAKSGTTTPSMFEGLRRYVPELRPFEDVQPLLKGADISGGVLGTVKNIGVAGGKLRAQLSGNPVVKYGVDIINAGVRAREAAAFRRLFDKDSGILQQMDRLTKNEQTALWQTMRKYNGKKWLSVDEMIREGFNDKQIHAYENYRTQISQSWNDFNLARKERGLDAIPAREGYVPARWVGRYYVRITDSTGRLLSVEARKGQGELKKLVEHLKKTNPEYKVSNILSREDIRQKKFGGDARNSRELFDQIAETLGRDSFEKAVLDQIIEDYNAKLPGGRKGFGRHTEEKYGVEGYRGTQEGMQPHEQFKEAMAGIDGYVHDLYDFVETQGVHREIAKLVNPDNGVDMPNAKKYVQDYWDHAQKLESQFSQVQRSAMESIPKAFGADPALIQKLSNGIRKQVVFSMLGYWRPSFLLAQFFQPIQMMFPALTEMRIRAPNESYTNTRGTAMARGWGDALHPESASALSKEALAYAKDKGVLKDTLLTDISGLNEMTQSSFLSKTFKVINGEIPMTAAENFARRAGFLQAVHMLEGSSLTKTEMFQAAGDIMDMAMTNYSHHEKAMGFTSLGEAGKWISPLQSFKMNWVSQRLKYAKLIAEDPKSWASYKPLAQSLVMDFIFAGIMGTALLKEMDLAIALLKQAGLVPSDTDDATGFLLKHSANIQGQGRDFVRYGVLSGASGFDFSPQYAMSQVFPHSAKDLLPVAGKALDIAGSALGVAKDPLSSEAQAKALSMLPGPAKAAGEALMAKDGMIPNPNRNMEGKVQRDAKGYAGSALGAGSIQEKEQQSAVMQNIQMEQQITMRKTKLMDKIKERDADGRDFDEFVDEFMDLGGTMREIRTAIKNDRKSRDTTQYERATKRPTNNNQRRQQMRLEEYGVREQ